MRHNRIHGAMLRFMPAAVTLLALVSGCSPSPHDLVARGLNTELGRRLEADAPSVCSARDRKGKTPLHAAVSSENRDAMVLLSRHGADVNATDITGMTPLHVAAMLGRAEEAEWLLDHGARMDMRDSFGDTPAHTAAVFGQGGVIMAISARGASLDGQNSAGKTPRTLAVENRQGRVAALLDQLHAQGSGAAVGGG